MRFTRTMAMAAVLAACTLGMAACRRASATGQVLATVGGKEITLQDVRAEGRADGLPASAGHAADTSLLQRVVDRELLAQSAHAQKLDQTPEAPSDLARVEQTWLADKAAKRVLIGMTLPTNAQAQDFVASHPYAFKRREKVSARTISIEADPVLYAQLKTYTSYEQALAFLKHLGVAIRTGEGQIDTARLPPNIASQLAGAPVGALLITQPPGRLQLAEVEAHTPIVLAPQAELDLAKHTLVGEAANQRLGVELKKLAAQVPVTYQTGYAPATTPAGANKMGN